MGPIPPFGHIEVKKDSFIDTILKIWIPLGALLIAGVSFFINNPQIPKWVIYIVVAYLVIGIVFILWRPGFKLYSRFKEKQEVNAVSRKFYPALCSHAEEFLPFMDADAPNSMTRFFNEIPAYFDGSPQKISWHFNSDIVFNIKGWYFALQKRLKSNQQRDFVCLAEDLQLAVRQYHDVCIGIRRELEEIVVKNSIADQTKLHRLKTEWNSRLGNYMDFIRRWQSFIKEVNKSSKTMRLLGYYDTVKSL